MCRQDWMAILKCILICYQGTKYYETKWDKPFVTFKCGFDQQSNVNKELKMQKERGILSWDHNTIFFICTGQRIKLGKYSKYPVLSDVFLLLRFKRLLPVLMTVYLFQRVRQSITAIFSHSVMRYQAKGDQHFAS